MPAINFLQKLFLQTYDQKSNFYAPPPRLALPILQKLVGSYKLWHIYWGHFHKAVRYGLGLRIDSLFLDTIENLFVASYKTKEKVWHLNKASDSFDVLKFLLQVAWELRALDNTKYIVLSKELSVVGKMLGGWRKQQQPRNGVVE